MINVIKNAVKTTASYFTNVNHQSLMNCRKILLREYHSGNISTVYDIGAHQGNWADTCRKLFPKCRVILFEANPDHTDTLMKKGHEHYIGILTKPNIEKLDFYTPEIDAPGTSGASYYKESTSGFSNIKPKQLPASSLEVICSTHNLPTPDLIKIDTQGSEMDVIEGGLKQFKGAKWVIMEMPVVEYNVGAPDMGEYINTMSKIGFAPMELLELHYFDKVLIQIDLLFIRKDLIDQNTRKSLSI